MGPIATPRQSLSSICGTLCLAALLTVQEEAAEEPNRPLPHGTSDFSPTPQGRGPLRTAGCPGRSMASGVAVSGDVIKVFDDMKVNMS
ncbi:hypothetical protein LEMLEM_LOCUS13620 [Lemmus lemmus]